MREIKFRAWDKKRKKVGTIAQIIWNPDFSVQKALIIFPDSQNTIMADTEEFWVDGINIELMQFTGLADINKREVCESDIVETNKGIRGIIYWGLQSARFGMSYRNIWHRKSPKYFKKCMQYVTSKCEVIGNIYENPELLEPNREVEKP